MRIDAQRHIADHVFVDRRLAFQFGDGGGGGVNVHQDIMRLAVLADAVGDIAKTQVSTFETLPPLSSIILRSEERRVGKSVSVRVDIGGRRSIKKKIYTIDHEKT